MRFHYDTLHRHHGRRPTLQKLHQTRLIPSASDSFPFSIFYFLLIVVLPQWTANLRKPKPCSPAPPQFTTRTPTACQSPATTASKTPTPTSLISPLPTRRVTDLKGRPRPGHDVKLPRHHTSKRPLALFISSALLNQFSESIVLSAILFVYS